MDTKQYWSERYLENRTGWDLGAPSPPLQNYIDQLTNKSIKILIPGAGNSYEAEYLLNSGFTNTHVLDIANEPLTTFAERNPDFPKNQLHEADFFEFKGVYDLIIEQTFFCSFPPLPETRKTYAKKIHELLKPNGKLVGLWFDIPLTGDLEKRPFGGDKNEYLDYFSPYFETQTFEECYNSIPPRQGSELFGIFKVKK
nr:methyltransferase domain-containing protein [Tenacibaculum agarivorans]